MALCVRIDEYTVDFEQLSGEYDPEDHFDDEKKVKRKDICDFLNYLKRMNVCDPARSTKHFYELNLVARICTKTTDEDVKRLLQNGTRMFLIPIGFHTPKELIQSVNNLYCAINEFEMSSDFIYPIGIGYEIKGEVLRTGRMRNDAIEAVTSKSLLVLTADKSYEFSSMKEIVYVHNLYRYIPIFKINDVVFIDNYKIKGRIVKIINQHVTILIDRGGLLSNYMNVDISYYIENDPLTEEILKDIEFVVSKNADFIFVPGVRNKNLLKNIHKHLQTNKNNLKVIAELDLQFLLTNFVDMCRVVKYCDGFFIEKIDFRSRRFLINMIDLARSTQKPVLGLIPIKKCRDFDRFENHEIIKMLDSMFIEKSNKQGRFPIIAKKLLPLPEELEPNKGSHKDPTRHCLSNCVKLTIKSIRCSAIIYAATNLDSIPVHLTETEIYCPVVVVCLNLAAGKYMNFFRNLKVIMYPRSDYSEDKLPNEQCMTKYGICFCRRQLGLKAGDFVLCTFETNTEFNKKIVKFCAIFLPEEAVVMNAERRTNERQCGCGVDDDDDDELETLNE